MFLKFLVKNVHLTYKNFKYSVICTRPMSNVFKSKRHRVITIPALNDNYMYLLIDNFQNTAVAVDPVEPEKILNRVHKENVLLKAVLTTHHHTDHAAGNVLLSEKIEKIPIYGGDDRIPALTTKLSHNELFQTDNTMIRCLHTPCHTSGHVCYFIESFEPICFTGDTLFIAGCGRFFEGSAEQMYKSLKILSLLPMNTKIYCGHEYTMNNLKFALFVEPENSAIKARLKSAEDSARKMEPTVPSTIQDEMSFNPFLRVQERSIQKFTGQIDPVSALRILRDMKDNFKS